MTTPHIDRQTFLARLSQSGLFSAEQLATLDNLPPTSRGGRTIARALVQQGLLTRFQAEQLLAGRTQGFLLGRYRILEQLGQGGMGRVYKAEHRTLKRIVALKVLAPHVLKTDRAQELFLHEVRAVAQLVHRHIVTAFDANLVGKRYFLVLEYINGPNLDQLVRARGPLSFRRACDYVRQVADGLQYAFSKGMVHRDIKPANLLLHYSNGERIVKISDFGLARLCDPEKHDDDGPKTIVTKANTIMGTPDFLAPEQARNVHQADIRSDLYGLGCTFYYLLTRRVPFPGGSTLEKLVRQSNAEPVPVERFRPDLPSEVVAVLRRLMAKDPAARFQTPAELIAALEPFVAQTTTSIPQSSSVGSQRYETASSSAATGSDLEPASPGAGRARSATTTETLPSDLSVTPLADIPIPYSLYIPTRPRRTWSQRWRAAFPWLAGFTCGLLLVSTVLLLFLLFGG